MTLYYVSYGNEVRVDLRNRVPVKYTGTALAVFHRSGVAWLYRGVLIGVAHDKGYWRHSKKHKSNIWYRPWCWQVWAPNSCTVRTPLDQLPARTLINQLSEVSDLVRARVDGALSTTPSLSGTALDGVPWEIHRIEDATARETASHEYLANRGDLRTS